MKYRRREILLRAAFAAGAPLTVSVAACGDGSSQGTPTPPPGPTRTWRTGFSGTPPRPDVATFLAGVDVWAPRAEMAAIHEELPWADLLGGMTAEQVLNRDKVSLISHYRSKGLQIYFMGDLTDGLDRARESPRLRALGRSITEKAVQDTYRDYMLAVARLLKPDYIGLAAETNLVRTLAPASLYAALVRTANDCAASLRSAGADAALLCSVQVEAAWGKLGSASGFVGVDADLRDFGFLQMLGLSSYPYFAYAQPEDLPADYYSRLRGARQLPMMVTEGGWTSSTSGSVRSDPQVQARYIRLHASLLDSVQAKAWLQLLFADLDLDTWPKPLPENLPLFAHIGLTDTRFAAKPALAEWDALRTRALRP